MTLTRQRRREERLPFEQLGRYLRSIDGYTCRLGSVKSLNNSATGMLLEASEPFTKGEVLEITFGPPRKFAATEVLEVCWSARSTQGGLQKYLLGCRRLVSVVGPHAEPFPLPPNCHAVLD